MLFAFLIRVYHIQFQSLWMDEFLTLKFAANQTPLEFLRNFPSIGDYNPPGYYFIINLLGQFMPLNELTCAFPPRSPVH